MIERKYGMGDKLRDKVSGLKGVVLGYTYYATGCLHYGLAPVNTSKDGGICNW